MKIDIYTADHPGEWLLRGRQLVLCSGGLNPNCYAVIWDRAGVFNDPPSENGAELRAAGFCPIPQPPIKERSKQRLVFSIDDKSMLLLKLMHEVEMHDQPWPEGTMIRFL